LLPEIVKALQDYGPFGVFALALIDSAGIPLPLGADALVLSIAWKVPGQAYSTAVLATVGSLCGNIGLFWAARHGGRRWVKAVPEPDRPQRFRTWFRRYGLLTVFIPATFPIPMPLKVFVVSAGVLHTRFGKFLAVILLARVIRYFGLAYLGIRLGENAGYFLQHNAFAITGTAVGLALGLVLLIKLNDRRAGNATIS